ncbi:MULTISPECIES: cation:proton antiporter [unclassified Nitratiruptor]|uniref:cation:proton antiporter n=1 Tax=unclassified Nitratiruptor TaxID=2624044 RepID=UPI0019151738|nr:MULTISPECIES: cation:proton antiporter [unclassified Nitratiruptor]BCD60955.1 cation:proton antiporter [Nitratiruptor sp. YY08-10]BCD64887.1 cation:proton antiporter [Nitratiruptor sp. YY08-14]
MNEIHIILVVSLIIFTSPFISKITRLPTSVVEIALGTIFGALGLLSHVALFELVAEFGFLYLMFLAGLEVDLKELFSLEKSIIKRGIVYIALLYLFSFLLVRYSGLADIYIAIFPLISVGLIAALKKEYGKGVSWLNLSMAIGSLGEVVSITVLTIMSAVMEFGLGKQFYESIFILSLFLLLTMLTFKLLQVLFWWYPELKTTLMPRIDTEEQDIRLSMALLFTFIAIMIYLHLEVAFGAFIAGIIIATFFEHKKTLPHKLSSFGFGFLVPIFFIFTGSSFKIEALFMKGMVVNALFITLAMIGVRFLGSIAFYRFFSLKEGILYALSHSMPLTLLVAIATIALHTKVLGKEAYLTLILASIIEVLIVMIAIRWIVKFTYKKPDTPH